MRIRRLTLGAVFFIIVVLAGARAPAQQAHRRVLLLYDEDRTLPGLAILDRSMRATFTEALGASVEFFTDSMNVSEFRDGRDEEALREFYTRKFGGRQLDLVVAVMGPALHFLLRHGDAAFPGVPVVFCGSDAADVGNRALPPRFTGILVQRVFGPTIEALLGLQPDTRRVFVVGGTSAFDRHLIAQARNEFKAFEARVSFEYLVDLPMDDLVSSVSRLPPQSAIAFVTLFRDGAGRSFVPHDVVSRLSAAANVPVYVFVDQYLGLGPVGGHLYSLERHGKSAAEVGLRVLAGEPPSGIPVREIATTANLFDARQLGRWGLDERRLPAGSAILFREPGLWDRYQPYLVGGATLVAAQTALTVALLLQRARRRRAEAALRTSYDRIRTLSRRLLETQDSERAHLARELHDDICQRLAMLQIDLETLMSRRAQSIAENESLVADATARAVEANAGLRDLSHRLHPAHLRLVGLTAALRSLQREMSSDQLSISFSDERVPAALPPDLALCLYRVAQEALNNAVKHGHADNVSLSLRADRDRLRLTIDDNGTGFDTRTAQPGLGLISMTERVEQAGGAIRVGSEPGRGTHVEVVVPCGQAPPGVSTPAAASLQPADRPS